MHKPEMSSILIVEDEITVGSTLNERLGLEGYATHWSKNLADASAILKNQKFDLALLDVQLPDGSGFDLAHQIRSHFPATSIVFLTAVSAAEDRIRGLESGAEDYIVKPFHFKELLLRIQNALKRAQFIQTSASTTDNNQTAVNRGNKITIGRATVDFAAFSIANEFEVGTLSHKECALLKLLYERRGQVVSRDEILNLVWSTDDFPTPRTVDNFILKLRKWIEPQPDHPEYIKSLRGVGYQLKETE